VSADDRPLADFGGFDPEADRERWPLTTAAIEASEPRPAVDEDDEPVQGNALLRALADDPANGLIELRPGFFFAPKN
jgi:hypothetical protein